MLLYYSIKNKGDILPFFRVLSVSGGPLSDEISYPASRRDSVDGRVEEDSDRNGIDADRFRGTNGKKVTFGAFRVANGSQSASPVTAKPHRSDPKRQILTGGKD